jgi:tetratricopeptide (TPR) repeat protein
VDSTDLVAEMAMYQDLGWILQGSHETLLFRLRPSAYDGDRGGWGVTLAENYAIRGNQLKAKAYADSALPEVEKQVKAAPNDALRHTLLGRAFAILGNKSAAVREGQRGVALLPIAKDVFLGPYLQHQLVRIYLEVGEPEKALDNLEPLLKVPYYLSSAWLKIDPMFDPLRKNPRFQRLVATP